MGSVFFLCRVGIRGFGFVGPATHAPQPIFSFPCRVGNKAGGEDAYPAGSVFRLGARGHYCSAARLHLCFGSFAFGTVSLVSVVPCTHPGTFCPGLILFYSLQSCARGRYSSLPRFWAYGERPMSHRSALSEPSLCPFGIRNRAELPREVGIVPRYLPGQNDIPSAAGRD